MLLLRHAAAWFAMLCFAMRAACFAMLLALPCCLPALLKRPLQVVDKESKFCFASRLPVDIIEKITPCKKPRKSWRKTTPRV
jgi:hypothetical protein